MSDAFFPLALSYAKIFLDTREQFAEVLRMEAIARIEGNPMRCIFACPADISRASVEPHVDDALYAIGRDGLHRLEDNIRFAIDEIVLTALTSEKKGALGE